MKCRVAEFKMGCKSTQDELGSERPTEATMPEMIEEIHNVVPEDG